MQQVIWNRFYHLQRSSKGQQKPRIHCESISQGSRKLPGVYGVLTVSPTFTTAEESQKAATLGVYTHRSWDLLGNTLKDILFLGGAGTEPRLFRSVHPYLRMLHSQHILQLFWELQDRRREERDWVCSRPSGDRTLIWCLSIGRVKLALILILLKMKSRTDEEESEYSRKTRNLGVIFGFKLKSAT